MIWPPCFRPQGRCTESEVSTREALRIRRELFGADSLEVADTLHNLCVVLGDEDKYAESEATAREMLAIRRRLRGNEDRFGGIRVSARRCCLGGNRLR